jgi:hypothetical protein
LLHAVPGFDAVRGGAAVGTGVYLVTAFLAGWGVWVVVERRRATVRYAITAAIVATASLEVFHPAFARYVAQSVESRASIEKPSAELIALYRDGSDGAVLDLPFHFDFGGVHDMAYYLFLGAFHRRPVGACYDSYGTPIQPEIELLANRLPDPRAADALCALGFTTIVVHEELFETPGKIPRLVDTSHFVESGRAPQHAAFRLRCSVPVESTFTALAATPTPVAMAYVAAGQTAYQLAIRNGSDRVYRHPDPLEPVPLLIRWYAVSGGLVAQYRGSALLPLALAPQEDWMREIDLPVPASSGVYQLTIAPVATPDLPLVRRTVVLAPSTATPPKGTR